MTTPTRAWWERHPGRLEYELQSLTAAGVTFSVDAAAKDGGLLRLSASVDVPGWGPVDVVVTFPDAYPYVRPEVAAPDLVLPHHQHPFAGNLCLIGRSSRQWRVGDTLAWLLTQQLPKTLKAGDAEPDPGQDRDALPEERQAEPFTDYYSCAPAAVMLIDSAWSVPDEARAGSFTFALDGPLPPATDGGLRTLGVIADIRTDAGETVAAAETRLVAPFSGPRLTGRWCRLDDVPLVDSAQALWDAAAQVDPLPVPRGPTGIQVRAVIIPEETEWREQGDGWVFIVRQQGQVAQQRPQRGRRGGGRPQLPNRAPDGYWLVRAGRAGPEDFAARVPELRGLDAADVVVAGVGAVGSSIVEQLTRAGVGRFRVVDSDVLHPGNLVRHAGRFAHVGMPKASVASAIASDISPYTTVTPCTWRLGTVRPHPTQQSDHQVINDALDGADLLIDATAELGLQPWLAAEALERGIAYLGVSATNGAWGGLVALLTPDTAGCWNCLQHHMNQGTIAPPPAAPTGQVQPAGCADPTFTGSGFDLCHVSLQAARVAVGYLLRNVEGGYPSPPGDVDVLALRDASGTATMPTWTSHILTQHPACSGH